MRRIMSFVALVSLTMFAFTWPLAAGRDGVVRFATLPPGPGNPEGIAADAQGNIYTASFDFSGVNKIYVFAPSGTLTNIIDLTGHTPLGLQFGPDGKLYAADFGTGKILQISGGAITNEYLVCGGPGPGCALNAIAFDAAGLLYVSDSFGGNVFTVNTTTGTTGTYLSHPLLRPAPAPHGFPPFGANGLAFDHDGNLYVANTADDRILKVTPAKVISIFTESINGADGIAFDDEGRLWVCANQENTLYLLDADGGVVDIRGSFEGIGRDGAVRGLLFPASVVPAHGSMYVTNAVLGFRHLFADEPPSGVTTFTLARVPAGPSR